MYLGFLWDVPTKTVILVERKRLKYIARLSEFLILHQDSQVSKRELQRIAGFLNHASFVIPHGRSYLSNLYSDISDYGTKDFIARFINKSTISDLKWWLKTLTGSQSPLDLSPRAPTRDYGIWVDASTGTGIGILWNQRWAFWRTAGDWRGPSRDIGWLEATAIELAIRLAYIKGIRDTDILIRSDNQGVIAAFQKGRCSNFMINLAIRRSEELLRESRLSITLVYAHTSTNLADPISRGILPSVASRLSLPPSLPPTIAPYFIDERE